MTITRNDNLFEALLKDDTEFVQGLDSSDWKAFLSIETLWKLYSNVLKEDKLSTELIKNQLIYRKQRWIVHWGSSPKKDQVSADGKLLIRVGELIAHLLRGESKNPYKDAKKYDLSDRVPELIGSTLTHSVSVSGVDYFDKLPERDLFFWAILFNRKNLALMFWRKGVDQLGAALIAYSLLKSMSGIADEEFELEVSEDLQNHANFYEKMATEVLSLCYNENKQTAHQLLVRQLKSFGKTTLFKLAEYNQAMAFMSQDCCQTKLMLVWMGSISRNTKPWEIVLTLLTMLYIPFVKFTTTITTTSSQVTPQADTETRKEKRKLYTVGRMDDVDGKKIGFCSAIRFFYTAPVTVFIQNVTAYLVFLGLFTYFLLIDLYPATPSVVEFIVWGWFFTMAVEEIRQWLCDTLRNNWNYFDLVINLFFIVSVILRLVLHDNTFLYARMLYSITLFLCYLRFIQTFFADRNIGPKVIMIKDMLADLLYFFFLFALFLLSFGVVYQANLYPNSPPSWYLLKSIVYIPYWQIYGELFLENMEGGQQSGCTTNETVWRASGGVDRCPEQNALVPVVAVFYLILTNLLLVNLLIAMFSNSFKKVQDQSAQVWRFNFCGLVHEYVDKPAVCPPFIILVHLFRVIMCLRGGGKKKQEPNELNMALTKKVNKALTMTEANSTKKFLETKTYLEMKDLYYKVQDAG